MPRWGGWSPGARGSRPGTTIRTSTSDKKKKNKLKCHQKITNPELWEVQGEGASVSAPGRTGEGFAEEGWDQQGLGEQGGCHRGAEVGGWRVVQRARPGQSRGRGKALGRPRRVG